MQNKFIWVQDGGGEFPIGNGITEFNCVFNPQKIKHTEPIPESVQSEPLFMFPYIPDEITLIPRHGGHLMMYESNIEKVRVAWFNLIFSHYKHLLWLGDLVELSEDWADGMKRITEESEKHKIKHPHLWV